MRSKPPVPLKPVKIPIDQTACFSHALELFQNKPGGMHPNYQSEFSWAEHVSLLLLLCSLEMPDTVLSPCALTHSLGEAVGALIAS